MHTHRYCKMLGLLPLQLLLLLHPAALEHAMMPTAAEQKNSGGAWITVALSDLINTGGVSSYTAQRCDLMSDCDTRVSVSVGTSQYGHDLLRAQTDTWKNRNSLEFVFLNGSFPVNNSIPSQIFLHIIAEDGNIEGFSKIGHFLHEVQMHDTKSTSVQLFSTPENRLIRITAQVTVTCFNSYHGPTCSDFCPSGTEACPRTGALELHGVQERASLNDSQISKQSFAAIIHWIAPAVGVTMLVVVMLALLLRWARTRSTKIIVAAPDAEGQRVFQRLGRRRQQPQQSAALLMTPSPSSLLGCGGSSTSGTLDATAGRYRNPVYTSSSLMGRSCSLVAAAGQLSPPPPPQLLTAAAAASSPPPVARAAAEEDQYEELDATVQQQQQQRKPPGDISQQRPLPPPGLYDQ